MTTLLIRCSLAAGRISAEPVIPPGADLRLTESILNAPLWNSTCHWRTERISPHDATSQGISSAGPVFRRLQAGSLPDDIGNGGEHLRISRDSSRYPASPIIRVPSVQQRTFSSTASAGRLFHDALQKSAAILPSGRSRRPAFSVLFFAFSYSSASAAAPAALPKS